MTDWRVPWTRIQFTQNGGDVVVYQGIDPGTNDIWEVHETSSARELRFAVAGTTTLNNGLAASTQLICDLPRFFTFLGTNQVKNEQQDGIGKGWYSHFQFAMATRDIQDAPGSNVTAYKGSASVGAAGGPTVADMGTPYNTGALAVVDMRIAVARVTLASNNTWFAVMGEVRRRARLMACPQFQLLNWTNRFVGGGVFLKEAYVLFARVPDA